MGNACAASRLLLPPEKLGECWEEYACQAWRSDKTKELDTLGGAQRFPVGSGGSFSALSQFLKHQLQEKKSRIEAIVTVAKPLQSKEKPILQVFTHTDRRAAEQRGLAEGLELVGPPGIAQFSKAKSNSFNGRGNPPAMPKQGSNPRASSARVTGSANTKQLARISIAEKVQRTDTHIVVADWRIRVHAARRRTMLIIMVVLRLKRGHYHHHARRQPRLDDLSYMIPIRLGADKRSYIKESAKLQAAAAEVQTLERVLQQSNQPTATSLGAAPVELKELPPSIHSSPCQVPTPRQVLPVSPRSRLNSISSPGEGLFRIGEETSSDLEKSKLGQPFSTPIAPAGQPFSTPLAPDEVPKQGIRDNIAPNPRSAPAGKIVTSQGRSFKTQTSLTSPPSKLPLRSAQGSLPLRDIHSAPPGASRANDIHSAPPGASTRANDIHSAPPGASRANAARRVASKDSVSWSSSPAMVSTPPPRPSSRPHGRSSYPSGLLQVPGKEYTVHRIEPSFLSNGASGSTDTQGSALSTEEIEQRISEQKSIIKASQGLMAMYMNRCNTAWSESQGWKAPSILSVIEEHNWVKGDHMEPQRVEVARHLKNGKIAVQLLISGQAMQLPDGGNQDLWRTDPWKLLGSCRRGLVPMGDRIEGVSLGARVMCNLVQQVTEVGGEEALSKLCVVLHMNEDQEAEITSELVHRSFYGLNSQNVMFVVQKRLPGYTYNQEAKLFLPASGNEHTPQTVGTGFSFAQMTWPTESFTCNDCGVKIVQPMSLAEVLTLKGVQWMVCRQMKDILNLNRDGGGILDCTSIAYRLSLQKQRRSGIITDCAFIHGSAAVRKYGNAVLRLDSGEGAGCGAVEMSAEELVAPKLMMALDNARAQCGGKQAVGMGRYLLHLPTLRGALESSLVYRPKLVLKGSNVHVQLDMADLTAWPAANCVAVEARQPFLLSEVESLDALISTVASQDANPGFRRMVVEVVNRSEKTASIVKGAGMSGESASASSDVGLDIMVFVCQNSISPRAVNAALHLTRPGRDILHIVTVVSSDVQRNEGMKVLEAYRKQAVANMTHVKASVLVRGSKGLLDSMERYIQTEGKSGRTLIVMGSTQVNSAANIMVSVTLNLQRRVVGIPILVVTQNSANSPTLSTQLKTSILLGVQPHTSPLLKFICTQLLAVREMGYKLQLAQVQEQKYLTRQQQVSHRRVLDNAVNQALGYHIPPSHALELEGPLDSCLSRAAEEQCSGIIAVQVPAGSKGLPAVYLSLLRNSRSAVLIYQ
ncbi:hypothetical protein CEUSTIGMA_g1609.t1 [Chlamydomonas eustigma]|uniref:Uncharacterized protein n=1 Tax=Chlamydomonas eustigma TaxID=1157962 RepID=A0A250WUC8_9CHLO|nr:hypothetical protein CEUSTIGMA_g1609.t1 [Chlamydomonas eustigma]|eukprot:GAX74160.1 hypothetical protein CEUSTIGMA_g1609.t1 [Chlamydomonas eustigma]